MEPIMNTIDVGEVIDNSRLSRLQVLVLVLCGFCMIIDGFDVQAMGYVAPAIIQQWGINKSDLGPVFGAGLIGMALGAPLAGILADRFGRRLILIIALVGLSAGMAATATADSVRDLLILRFLAGFCMGAIVPNAMAMAGEFSPARIRVTLMMLTSCGFVVGGALGGTLAVMMIEPLGWQSVFLVGAVAPLLLAILMMVLMPESIQFMVLRQRQLSRVRDWLRRIDGTLRLDEAVQLQVRDALPGKRSSMLDLVRDSRGLGTAMLWIILFMNLLGAYFLASWLPVIMHGAGHDTSSAVLAGTLLWMGGIVGNLVLGWLVDRRGFGPVLVCMFAVAAVAIAVLGQVATSMVSACVVIAIAGFCILGGQSALNALATVFYPTTMRSTGAGWALGIGRLGSILGPMIGGELMRLGWTPQSLLLAAAIPALLAMLASLLFWTKGGLPGPVLRAPSSAVVTPASAS
ncbi:4-hydroxybenzoate transporter [Pseudomonas frederiksbergensis]|uniref:4-hydroxybenzoate transporter n=2 Tax=Pseudomonas frederiksbergensis TaxID=104087 RepID=A0A423K049_9PSED|nr:4-hydroxybenzoate transporter [Pseudomonas frederiksbergensis]